MTKTSNNPNDGKDKLSSQVTKTNIFQNSATSKNLKIQPRLFKTSKSVVRKANTQKQTNIENVDKSEKGGQLVKVETAQGRESLTEPPGNNATKSTFQKLKVKILATLIGSTIMLPILGVGTATYYFGSQAVNKQAILAKRSGNASLTQKELAQEQKLLAILLIGTGTTALLAGAIAALGTKKLLDSISQTSTQEAETQIYRELERNSTHSTAQKKILQAIVREARSYLNCDRVIVYNLNQDNFGEIAAESVAVGYTSALGKIIKDPCFEVRYLSKYRDGRVRKIDDVDKEDMTPCYREQLEKLEVKSNLVTPIVNQGKLFGLLVAHQCKKPKRWKQGKVEFLRQLAKKAGLALENSRLLDNVLDLQAQSERERKWTHYFTDAIQYIRQSIKQDDVLDISVEEVRRVLECDRVVVYSLDRDKYGVVIAESVLAGYSRALNKTIEDPCFEARYLDKYRDGRVRAINDIYSAGMSKCYIEQLETLEVKANLVTPILNEGKLFGLLVAHQCSKPRLWQDYEIRWVSQIATQVGFALDNAQVLAASATSQIQAERERKWTHYFTDAIQYIRQSIKQDDVLDISVEEVRRILKCDRVVVYSLDRDKYGVVIAESVLAGYSRALNKTIEDPCFEARYLDKYRDGRVRAINDIYSAGMSKCYIEQLETLEVKANLVTPILNEGKLFGLLVAHQCSKPRLWQDYEIRWVSQIATQVGFALDNAQVLAASAISQIQAERERKWTHYFTDAIQYIRQSIKQDDVLDISVEEVRRILKCDRVVVYSLNRNKYGVVIAESVLAGYSRALNKTIEDPCFEARYLDKYRDGRVRAINDIYSAGMSKCYIEQLETLEVKANLVTPILNEGKLFGLLVAHQCSKPRQWQDYEIRWVSQIATQVGFALDNAALLQKLKNNGLPTQLLNNFSLGISEKVSKSELLEITVEQARKIIKLDRTIVYQFDANWNGDIVAESVLTGYPRALNARIKDPCFAKKYGEKYRQGRTKAISNVDLANLTDCHKEQLESLSVKASIVVPILQDEQLFGLLIGHQCKQPRLWEQWEIDLFAQLALQLGFALERIQLREKLDVEKNVLHNEVKQTQLEKPNLDRQISQLLLENQAALEELRTKINRQSSTTQSFFAQILEIERQTKEIINSDSNPQQLNYQTKQVEALNKSHQNLDQMVNLINQMKAKIDYSALGKSAQLPIGEITIESSDAIFESSNSYDNDIDKITGQLVESSEAEPNLLLINQFVGEITNLSDRIAQQSLIVTDSFQKLAEFAQQLSKRKKP